MRTAIDRLNGPGGSRAWCAYFVFRALPAALLLLLTACTTTTRPGVTGVSRSQLITVSAETVESMSAVQYEKSISEAKAGGKLITGGEEFDRLKAIEDRLVKQCGVFRDDTGNWKWQMVLIENPAINASCAPGGKITFYTGIVRKLKLTDDEIAAVMGHEISHALREHGREKVSQASMENLVVLGALAATQGNAQGISQAQQLAEYVFKLPFSREMESEADKMGLELMARGGYDPRAAITLWGKMSAAEKSQSPEFLSTHPANATRITEIKALLPSVMPLYESAKRSAPPAGSGKSAI